MPLRASPQEVAAALDAAHWPDQNTNPVAYTSAVKSFIDTWFCALESDLIFPFTTAPLPFPPPGWLPKVTAATARDWAEALHATWGTLCRAAAPSVHERPQLHTLLPVPGPFIIPGSRFREGYYWDSYWAVRGLLISGLTDLAQNVVLNLVHCVITHGFVPNGLRSYYLNRSQPPLLAAMVEAVWVATKDKGFLKQTITALDTELRHWRTDPKYVMVLANDGQYYHMSRYYAHWEGPRPESYKEDIATAKEGLNIADGIKKNTRNYDIAESENLFRDIASAAESGWDFSSRWFADGKTLPTIRTTQIIPADLNALLYKAEKCLAGLAREVGQEDLALHWSTAAGQRLKGINALHWDPEHGRWRDILIEPTSKTSNDTYKSTENVASYRIVGFAQSSAVYASDFVPLWCGCAEADSAEAIAAINALNSSGLLGVGGIAASTIETGEQWDWPNAWPPLQSMIGEGAEIYGGEQGAQLAKIIAQRYLKTSHAAWVSTGCMYEKFDVCKIGAHGGGGEYACMDGFGWTNGLALVWLDKYGWKEGDVALSPL